MSYSQEFQERWQGLKDAHQTFRGKRILEILQSDYHDYFAFEVKEIMSGMVIVDFFHNGLIGSNLLQRIYQELGMIVQALEPSDSKTRFWFGDKNWCNKSDSVHPIFKQTTKESRGTPGGNTNAL